LQKSQQKIQQNEYKEPRVKVVNSSDRNSLLVSWNKDFVEEATNY
jgi:hypothetical protein